MKFRPFMTWEEVCRRASGRRAYNARRRFERERRRLQVAELLSSLGGDHGSQAAIARALGVSEATVSRDVASMHREWLRERLG